MTQQTDLVKIREEIAKNQDLYSELVVIVTDIEVKLDDMLYDYKAESEHLLLLVDEIIKKQAKEAVN